MTDAQLLELMKFRLQSINEDWLTQSSSALKLSNKNKMIDAYHKFCIIELYDIFEWLMTNRSDISAIKTIYFSKKYATTNMKQAIDMFIDKICKEKTWTNLNDSLLFGDMFLNT